MPTDKQNILGNIRGAVAFLEQAQDGIEKLWADGEQMLSREEVDTIANALKKVTKYQKGIRAVNLLYTQIVVSREAKIGK